MLAARNGEYLYLEGNDGQPGDTADLESPLLQHQGPICFSFYYFMWGSGVGELDVIQRVSEMQPYIVYSQGRTVWVLFFGGGGGGG